MRMRHCERKDLQSSSGSVFGRITFCGIVILFSCLLLVSQEPSPSQEPSSKAANGSTTDSVPPRNETTTSQNNPEITSREVTATFKASVNLVTVHAVVRDGQGRARGDLTRDDFHVFDNGKPQVISRFSVETTRSLAAGDVVNQSSAPTGPETSEAFVPPNRYIALVIDDLHGEFGGLVRLKQAAERAIFASLQPTDRVAVFTTSGVGALDFTDDQARLRDALLRLQPRPSARGGSDECPHMTYYMADLIINWNDQRALAVAAEDARACLNLRDVKFALQYAQLAARRELEDGDAETRLSLGVLQSVVRRMTTLAGQRIVILASPGFLLGSRHTDAVDVIDRANNANVLINSLDTRGLYVNTAFKAETPSLIHQGSGLVSPTALFEYQQQTDKLQADVLWSLAESTGGTFFHNSNDLEAGVRRVTAAPEYVYVLAFSPKNLKRDGKFHDLKVTVDRPNLTVAARRGYFAPKEVTDPEEAARNEITDIFFSQQEVREIPFELHSEFFKAADGKAHLSLVTRVDIRTLPFRNDADRHCDNLNVVSGVFDRNGTLLEGMEKIVELRLRERTREALRSGIAVKSTFAVEPGQYIVRVVVRDTEGKQLSAKSSVVVIP